MKRILAFLALASCAVAGTWVASPGKGSHAAAGGGTVTDNFDRADANPIGGNWTTITGFTAIKILTNRAMATADSTCGVWYNAATPSADHYSQCVPVVGSGFQGPAVRIQSGTATFYLLQMSSASTVDVFRINSGTFTNLVAGRATSAITVGTTVMKLAVSGTGSTVTLKVYLDGVQQGADITDTSGSRITTAGSFGIYAEETSNGVDNWEGGW